MNAISQKLFVSFGTIAALGCGAAWAGTSAGNCGSVSRVQQHIVEHADQDMDSLREYVHMTNVVYGINMEDVKSSLDTWRAAIACQKVAASEDAIETAKEKTVLQEKVLTSER